MASSTEPSRDDGAAVVDVSEEANIGEDPKPIHQYPGAPLQHSYDGPAITEVGTDAVNRGINRSKIRCIIHIKSLPFRWKLSVMVTVTAFVLSTIVVNSCNFVSLKRLYTDDQITSYFGRGVIQGQVNPWDECTEWRNYENLDLGARVEAARVGSVACVIMGGLLIFLLMKDALCEGCWTTCFPRRMWRSIKFSFSLLAAGFQALVQLLVWSQFCKKEAIEGDDDGKSYIQTCSTDTIYFGISLAVICLYLVDVVLVSLN